jgi:hypothetical protein
MSVSIFQNRTHYRVTLILSIYILYPALSVMSATFPKPDVISRTEWGCPEGQSANYNYTYKDVTHIIVHHTDVYRDEYNSWPKYAKNNDWAKIVLLILKDHVKWDDETKTKGEDGWATSVIIF